MPRDFPEHTERALNGVLDECNADDACRNAFPQLRDDAKKVLARLLNGPVAVDLKRPPAAKQFILNSRVILRGKLFVTCFIRLVLPAEFRCFSISLLRATLHRLPSPRFSIVRKLWLPEVMACIFP